MSGSRRDRTPWFGAAAPYGRPSSARADRYYRGVASTRHSCHRMETGRKADPSPSLEAFVTDPTPVASEPLVAVIIPALNEAGKIGRVLDKFPRDGRFEAIVVDDGSVGRHRRRSPRPRRRPRDPARCPWWRRRRDPRRLARRHRAWSAVPRPPLGRRSARPVRARGRARHAAQPQGGLRPGLPVDGRRRRGSKGRSKHGHADLLRGVQRPGPAPRVRCHERLPDLPVLDPVATRRSTSASPGSTATTSSRTCCTRRSGADTR